MLIGILVAFWGISQTKAVERIFPRFVPHPKKHFQAWNLSVESGASMCFAQNASTANGYIKSAFPVLAPHAGMLLQYRFEDFLVESGYFYHTGGYAFKVQGVDNQDDFSRRKLSNALSYNRIPLRLSYDFNWHLKYVKVLPFVGTSYYFKSGSHGILTYNQDYKMQNEGDLEQVTSSFSTILNKRFFAVNVGAKFGYKRGNHQLNVIIDYNWNNADWQVTQAVFSSSSSSGQLASDIAGITSKVNVLGVAIQYSFNFYRNRMS